MNIVSVLLCLLFAWTHPHAVDRVSRAAHRAPICVATAQERWIIARESHGDVHAYNPVATSTGHAFGLGQLTTENRRMYGSRLGIDPDTTNYCDQLRLMRAYVADIYTTTENAVEHEQTYGWY